MNNVLLGVNGGKFTIEVELGRGGFGVVYLAKNQNGDYCALKMLHGTNDKNKLLSFNQEIESVSGLISENLLPIIDYGRLDNGNQNDSLFAVYPYCESGDYRKILDERFEINIDQVVNEMIQILSGLSILHSKIIHRDLKPQNILVKQNVLMIGDYGLSKFVDQATRTLTFKGLGTPIYMAPEVWQSETITKATDLYAFGIIFFESLTGKLPFNFKDIQELQNNHLYTPASRARSLNPEIPEFIDGIIKKLLLKEPGKRYQDANEVLSLLKSPLKIQSSSAQNLTDKIKKYHDKQEETASLNAKEEELKSINISKNKYKETELLDLIDEAVAEINSGLAETKIEKKIVRDNYEYKLGHRTLQLHFYSYDELEYFLQKTGQINVLKENQVAHGGYLKIIEPGQERDGWNIMVMRPPESMYGEWYLIDTEELTYHVTATKYSSIATDLKSFRINLSNHFQRIMNSFKLKRKKLETEHIYKIIEFFIP